MGSITVVSCALELILVFSVVFYLFKAAHTFYYEIVLNPTPNKLQPVETKRVTKNQCFLRNVNPEISDHPLP